MSDFVLNSSGEVSEVRCEGSKGLAFLGPFLGAPVASPGQVRHSGRRGGVRGLSSPDSLLGAIQHVAGIVLWTGTKKMLLMRNTVEQIVVYQYHRSWRKSGCDQHLC